MDRTASSTVQESDELNDQHRYDLASLLWMGFLAILAGAIWLFVIPQLTLSRAEPSRLSEARDDADAIIEQFGRPEGDSAVDSSSGSTVRMLTYRDHHVRVAFVRRTSRRAPPTWKLSGFLDLERDALVEGREALKRLNTIWH
jgi:hypothetical protein